jgi:hypothetical protein
VKLLRPDTAAVTVFVSTVAETNVVVACPLLSVTTEVPGLNVLVVPVELNVTVLLGTGLLYASSKVTVSVAESAVGSAST